MRRRFLKCFEKRVRCRAGDLMRFVNDVELGLQLLRRVFDALAQIANIIDAAIAGGVDLDHIGGGVGGDREQFAQALQGRFMTSSARQLTAFASNRAVVVLPVPRGPQKRYACATRSDNRVPEGLDDMLLADQLVGVETIAGDICGRATAV